MHVVEPTSVVTNMIKKSNSYHDPQYQQQNRSNHRQHTQDNIIIPSNTTTTTTTATRRHRQRQQSSNQNVIPSERCAESQTPAVYINSQHMSKQMKKATRSPHRSRSTHSRVSSSNNNNNTNSKSAGHYQTPYAATSHSSTVSSTRRHLRSQQEARKSEGYSNHNRRIQVTMQEASLIAIQPIDKLITPKRPIHR
ncbi:unnamed protein product [Trichobilharzia szidati]|nr:unnamed protein product [Trichobilharzia szidati]